MEISKDIQEKVRAQAIINEAIDIKEEIKKVENTEEHQEIKDISEDFEQALKINADKEQRKEEKQVQELLEEIQEEGHTTTNADDKKPIDYLALIVGGASFLALGIGAILYFGKDSVNTNVVAEAKGADSWMD